MHFKAIEYFKLQVFNCNLNFQIIIQFIESINEIIVQKQYFFKNFIIDLNHSIL